MITDNFFKGINETFKYARVGSKGCVMKGSQYPRAHLVKILFILTVITCTDAVSHFVTFLTWDILFFLKLLLVNIKVLRCSIFSSCSRGIFIAFLSTFF